MKKLFTLFIIAFCIKHSAGQKLVTTYYDWNKIHPKEKYYVNSAGQMNGSYKFYDQNGVIVKEYNYVNGVENGMCIDYAAIENNQRVVAAKGNFKNGVPDGYYVQYCGKDDYKSKAKEGRYKNGKEAGLYQEWWCTDTYHDKYNGVLKTAGVYKEGKYDSIWTTYHKTGQIESRGNYKNGEMDGVWSYSNSKGQIEKIVSYNNGIKDRQLTTYNYDGDGNLKSVGSVYDAGFNGELKDGQWRFYNPNGSLYSRGNFKKDKKDGLWTFYDSKDSAKILNSGNYLDGSQVGAWKLYYDKNWKETTTQSEFAYYRLVTFDQQGNVSRDKVEDYYITGEKQWEGYLLYMNPDKPNRIGKAIYYYKSGKLKAEVDYDKATMKNYYETEKLESEGAYVNGKQEGVWKYYSEDGKLNHETTYRNGEKE